MSRDPSPSLDASALVDCLIEIQTEISHLRRSVEAAAIMRAVGPMPPADTIGERIKLAGDRFNRIREAIT